MRRAPSTGHVMLLPLLACCATVSAQTPANADAHTAVMIARAKSLELPGAWTPPPGDVVELNTAGFAKTLCSAVFITGLDPADAAANVGFFTGAPEYRGQVVDTVVDRERQEVRLRLPNGVTRVARRFGSQGCVTLPAGHDSVFFRPSVVRPDLPDPTTTVWPMGDVLPRAPWPKEIDSTAFAAAMDAGFGPPEAMTEAFLVTYKGRILGERYAPGIGIHTPLESWSMGKSIVGTLVARLIRLGVYRLDQPAPIPEWQQPGDPRQAIRIMDLMRMSSGLRSPAPLDPGFDASRGYPDHKYFYTGAINVFAFAASRTQQWPPNTVGRYRNVDPVLAGYLVRLGAERLKQDYHAFPQRVLFDKLGIRDAIIETDPYGNFMFNGYDLVAARDWARLGNLYVQDGVWQGERLLPKGYVDYVRTPAPAWVDDGRPEYGGGFFWLNADGDMPGPRDAFMMGGAGQQSVVIMPSHGLVVVRLGKYRGERAAGAALDSAIGRLMQAVPPIR